MIQYKPVFYTLLSAVVLYLIHNLVFFLAGNLKIENPTHSLEVLYSFFTICSIFIIMLLIKVSQKSFDNVGMVFLIATSIKMVVCYFVLQPILNISNENIKIEKMNFFMMFILFLAIETVITIRILNNKQ